MTTEQEPQLGTYKYHMAKSVEWASKAQTRTSELASFADMKMAEYHYNLATEARKAGK